MDRFFEVPRDPSIAGFCRRTLISRSSFYNLVAAGEAPRMFRIGKLVRISAEAEAEWVRRREALHAGEEVAA